MNGPTGQRPMRMRQYRRNLLRTWKKNPAMAAAYADELRKAARRQRTAGMMRFARLLAVVAALGAGAVLASKVLG